MEPDVAAVKIPDFKELIAKMQAELPNVPQRRVYESAPAAIEGRQQNRYLALAAELAANEKEFDPIYTYDLNGNRISMIDPTGVTSYSYDALNRLTLLTNPKGQTTTFSYDALGRRTSMNHGNGVVTSYNYDAASQLLSLVHQLGASTLNSFSYTYDRVGNRKTKVDSNGTASYTYDTLNRLVQSTNPLPSNPLESFTYDAVGNRTASNQNGASTFNLANQLLEDASFTYQYDNNGNQTRKTAKIGGQITSYEYDAENKLVRVIRNGTTINYRYDGLGRRVEKEVNDGVTTKVTRYILDNEDILLELDGNNQILARYTHGPSIDEPLVMEKGGVSLFYQADGLGSITEITNQAGIVVQRYTYSSFGKIESQLDPSFVQPYTFTAREFDPETGLYFYRARSYDPVVGRFSQEDPIGFAGGDLNLYVYVANNPLVSIDSWGLKVLNPDNYPIHPAVQAALEKFNDYIGQHKDIVITGGDRPGDLGYHGKQLAADIKVLGQPHLQTANQADESGLFGGIGWYEEGYYDPNDPKVGPHVHVDLRVGKARWGFDKSGRRYRGYFPKYSGDCR